MDYIRVAGINPESVVDGPGFRFVIFAQGCPHHCQGCHNPDTWDPAGGEPVALAEVFKQICANPLLKGITLSGGEPFLQAFPLAKLARQVRDRGMDVITYTGFSWEQLISKMESDKVMGELLVASDFLVDGPFVEKLRDLTLPFRGSSNQRVIDVKASLAAGRPVPAPWGRG